MANDGRDYERFVKRLQQALLISDQFIGQNNIEIEVNKILQDNCGINREFDLYWEYELAGIVYKTIIECRDRKSQISIDQIDALIGKTKDLPDIKAVFATNSGYQSGARIKANSNKIDLLIVREQIIEDWTDSNGNPLIKDIAIDITLDIPPRTIGFSAEVDRDWAKTHTNLDLDQTINLQMSNDAITIEDLESNDTYTALQLVDRLGATHAAGEHGIFSHKETFRNAYMHSDTLKLKLRAFTITYAVSLPIKDSINIDLRKELIGVIEYLQRGTKTAIFTNKVVKDWN